MIASCHSVTGTLIQELIDVPVILNAPWQLR